MSAAVISCDAPPEPTPDPAASASGPTNQAGASRIKPHFVQVPDGTTSGKELVKAELAKAEADGVKLVLYVGATWCEPCTRFHDKVIEGGLDAELAGVRFLEFDLDAHEALLAEARCASKLVPLFARAEPDGTCSRTKRTEGAVKGEGAVGVILPRLSAILR